jgi:hypothetical protein
MEPIFENQRREPSPSLESRWEAIPENIRVIRQFPKPHDHLFHLAKTIPYWWQLANSAPALAFLVARCWCFDGLPKEGSVERIRAYVLLKRTEICGAFGFLATQRTVHLLSRVLVSPAASTLIFDLKVMRKLLRWEPSTYDILEQFDEITTRQLSLLATGPDLGDESTWKGKIWIHLPWCEWFFRLPAAKRFLLTHLYHEADRKSSDVVIRAFLGDPIPFIRFRNERKAFACLHDYLKHARKIRMARYEVSEGELGWPEPPIESTEQIIPILSCEELEAEGDAMKHCVAFYKTWILRGDYYVYRMQGQYRCTVGIEFQNGSWKIDQVRGIGNERVSDPATLRLIEKWIASAPATKRTNSSQSDCFKEVARICGLPLRGVRIQQEW